LLELGVHPSAVRWGYETALATATETLASLARPLDPADRDVAEAVARSAMNGNDIGGLVDTWVPLAVDVVERVGEPTEKTFAVRTKRTGHIGDSHLVDGAVLDRTGRADDRMPTSAEAPSVLVLGGHETGGLVDPTLDRDWTAGDAEEVDPGALSTAFDGRREEVISNVVTAGADVVVARQGMETPYRAALADHGILGLRGVNRLKLAQVALATGATIVNDVTDIRAEHLGEAGRVAVRNHDPRPGRRRKRKMTVVEGCSVGVGDRIAMGFPRFESSFRFASRTKLNHAIRDPVSLREGTGGGLGSVAPDHSRGSDIDVGVRGSYPREDAPRCTSKSRRCSAYWSHRPRTEGLRRGRGRARSRRPRPRRS